MPTTTRTIRVFISSTFSDLKVERNALQERVFPRLKRYCQRHGWSFQAIDLRWGISHEAALDQSTMRICRAEIARCQAVTPRPNFVVLLGDRHGWRPLPDEIPAAEFEALRPHLPAELANRWYQLDENAVCPLPDGTGLDKGRYILQPRTSEFTDYDKWFAEVEGPLGDAFRRVAHELGLPEDVRRKYEASATAQEIHDGAFAVPDAREHVVAFIREIRTADGRPLRETLPGDPALKDFVDLKQDELDRESQDQLDALKKELRAHLGEDRVKTYAARWEGNGTSTEHLNRLCLDVLRSLGRLIHAQIKSHSALPPLEEERLRHQEFAQRRARDFTGQVGPLGEIERYLAPTSDPSTPLVVHGASGSGKSALLAKAVEEVAGGKWQVAGVISQKAEDAARPSTINSQPSTLLYRFIGATAHSTDPRSLLEGLCQEIYAQCGFEEVKKEALEEISGEDETARKKRDEVESQYAIPSDLPRLASTFRRFVDSIPADHSTVLMLDALDQLQVSDRPELSWLPDKLPAHVRLVVSAIPGPMLDALKSRLPSARFLELGPMRAEDTTALLQKWLHRAGRRLAREEQRQAIRDGFTRCSLPLYLRLAFEEAQRWRSYDDPPPPSPDVDGLIERLFSRLSKPANHGPLLVERAVSYLRCSRHGLSEDETLDLLANDPEYWAHFRQSAHHALPVTDGQQTRRLPVVIWSRLYHDLEPNLSWRSADGTALMVFFHTRFNEVADRQFLRDDAVRRARHDSLATYFYDLADPERKQSWTGDSPRPFLQVAFHLAGAQRLDELCQTLCDLRFVEARCRVGQVFELIADYRLAQEHLPEAREDGRQERERQARAEKWTKEIIEYARKWSDRRDCAARGETVTEPQPALPEIIASVEPWSNERIEAECKRIIENPTRLDHFRKFAGFVASECYPLLAFGCRPGFVAQHAFNQMPRGPMHDAAARLIGALDIPLLLRRWPPNALDNPKPPLIFALEGHVRLVGSVSVTPDGRFAVSGSDDCSLRVWDLANGACLRTLAGHSGRVGSVSVTPDGRRALSGSTDKTLRVWDLDSGQCLRTLGGYSGKVSGVSVTPDGRRAVSGSDDKTLRVWDLESGRCVRTLAGHSDKVSSVSVTPDGRCAVSGSWHNALRVWDLESGQCVQTLEGHSRAVLRVSVTPDGRRALSGSFDNALRVWDLESGACLHTLTGHVPGVVSVSVTPDGRHAVSASSDRTLRVWDIEKGACIRSLSVPSGGVKSVSVTPDGRRAVSGSMDNIIRVWNLESGACLRTHAVHSNGVKTVSVTPDSRRAVSGDDDNTLRVWDLESGQCLRTLAGHSDLVLSVSVTPDGQRVVSGSWDNTLRVWDLESGACLHTLQGHSEWVNSVSVTPDGRRAVSGSQDNTVRIWDLDSGQCLRTLAGHTDVVSSVSVTPDGKRVLSGSRDSTLRVWDLESGGCLQTLKDHDDWPLNPKMTPDGRRVISQSGEESDDVILRVLDLGSGTCLRQLAGHSAVIGTVCMMLDGRHVVSGSLDKTLRVWNVESGQCLRTLEGHTQEVVSVCVTPDGRYAVSGSKDKTIRVWDLDNGQCLGLYSAPARIRSVAFANHCNMICVETTADALFFLDLRGIEADRDLKPDVAPNISDEDYEGLLLRGLEFTRHEKGNDHEETLAHLAALAVHLQKMGETDESRAFAMERDRLAAKRNQTDET